MQNFSSIYSAVLELGTVRSEKLSLAFLTLKLTSEVNENYPTTDYMTWKNWVQFELNPFSRFREDPFETDFVLYIYLSKDYKTRSFADRNPCMKPIVLWYQLEIVSIFMCLMNEYKGLREWLNDLKISFTKSLIFACIRVAIPKIFHFFLNCTWSLVSEWKLRLV